MDVIVLAAYKKAFIIGNIQIDLVSFKSLNTWTPDRLNGAITQNKVKGVLERKEYNSINMLFPFIVGSIEREIGCVEQAAFGTLSLANSILPCRLILDLAAVDTCGAPITTSFLYDPSH